jgi:hypothetical protein
MGGARIAVKIPFSSAGVPALLGRPRQAAGRVPPPPRMIHYARKMTSPKEGARETGKPHAGSVTDIACTCAYLQRAAEEPTIPIDFDAEMNEFHITGKDGGHSVIYHCPFCGGAAPRSRRASFFATITHDEQRRLAKLTTGLATIDDVIARFGKADQDLAEGLVIHTAESETEPSRIRSYRTLRYCNLSETADVDFTDYGPDRGVSATFRGKFLGRPKS